MWSIGVNPTADGKYAAKTAWLLASGRDGGDALWRSDGTAPGTLEVDDLRVNADDTLHGPRALDHPLENVLRP